MSKARQLADLGNQVDDGAITGTNMVVNGAMTVAQRGSSYQFSNTNTSAYGAADRWEGRPSQGTTITQSLQSDAPAGFSKSLRYYCDSGGTITSIIRHQQKLEGQDWQHLAYGTSDAKTITLSFWVKSNVTATYTISLYVYDANDIYTVTYTVDNANTWEYKTLTFSGNTTGNCNNDNTHGVELAWALGAASGFKSSGINDAWQSYATTNYATGITADIGATTGNYWQITGVCLNVGDSAIDFPHESFAETLARCRRYFEVNAENMEILGSSGAVYGIAAYGPWQFQVEKRANPTVCRWQGAATDYRLRTNGNNFTCTSLALTNSSTYGCRWDANASGLTGGQGIWLSTLNTPTQFYADAEL